MARVIVSLIKMGLCFKISQNTFAANFTTNSSGGLLCL